jgi:hypothetical protein
LSKLEVQRHHHPPHEFEVILIAAALPKMESAILFQAVAPLQNSTFLIAFFGEV